MSSKRDTNAPILEDQLGLSESEALEEGDTNLKAKPHTLSQDDVLADGLEKPKPIDLRPWYKQPKILGIIAAGVLIVLILIGALTSWSNANIQSAWMQNQWRAIRQDTEKVSQEAGRGRFDSFDGTVRSLTELQDRLDDTIADSRKQPTWFTSAASLDAYRTTLETVKDYTDKAQSEAGDLSNVGDAELEDLKSLATKMKLAIEDNRDQAKALSQDLDQGFYTLNERYKTVIEDNQSTEDQKKSKENEAKSAEEQLKQNQVDAESAVTRWIQAYIAGNVNDMKKYMTTAFGSEFKFEEVTGSYRQYNYPTTFRRISTGKKTENYEVVAAITFVTKSDYTADTNYSNNYTFFVTQDKNSKKWLINSRNP